MEPSGMGSSKMGAKLRLPTFFSDGNDHKKFLSWLISASVVLYLFGLITLKLLAREIAISLTGLKKEF
jgi:hypothetical protein